MEEKTDYDILVDKMQGNIIKWYPFEKVENPLEIAPSGNFIQELKTKFTNLEETKKIDENAERKFDLIIFIGTGKELEEQLPCIAKQMVQEGKLLIITDNQLSVQKMITKSRIEKEIYNKKQLEDLLEKYTFKYYRFYYPLQNDKFTNVIFSDQHLPDIETISRNITFYPKEDILIKTENEVFSKMFLQDRNLFKVFANSFFIECSRSQLPDNQIEFVSFSNIRKDEYSIQTIIKGKEVYKTAANPKAKEHIEQIKQNIEILKKVGLNTLDSYHQETIISQYQENEKTLDKIIYEELLQGNQEKAKQIIRDFYHEIKQKLEIYTTNEKIFDRYNIEYQEEEIENLIFLQYGLWDLIFQNAFYLDNKFFFYDQEWIEEGIPLQYILYRAIEYSQGMKEYLTDEIYQEFEITPKQIELFKKLDDILQQKTRDEFVWNVHANRTTLDAIGNKIQAKEEEISKLEKDKEIIENECKELLNQKDARIKFLEENMEKTCNLLKNKEEEIIRIKNSISWKITKPLRRLRGEKKGEENENKR